MWTDSCGSTRWGLQDWVLWRGRALAAPAAPASGGPGRAAQGCALVAPPPLPPACLTRAPNRPPHTARCTAPLPQVYKREYLESVSPSHRNPTKARRSFRKRLCRLSDRLPLLLLLLASGWRGDGGASGPAW